MSSTSAKEKGIHEVSVDMTARIPAPAVLWITLAKFGLVLITPLTISEIKNTQNSTEDQIGTQDFNFWKFFFIIFKLRSSNMLDYTITAINSYEQDFIDLSHGKIDLDKFLEKY